MHSFFDRHPFARQALAIVLLILSPLAVPAAVLWEERQQVRSGFRDLWDLSRGRP